MKLRLRGDFLRLRLSRSEVAELLRLGALEEATAFGPTAAQRLVYAVRVSDDVREPAASFADNRITVTLPGACTRTWAGSATVGLYAEAKHGLRIAVEKDFKCLEPRPLEDDSDAFDHPGGAGHCAV